MDRALSCIQCTRQWRLLALMFAASIVCSVIHFKAYLPERTTDKDEINEGNTGISWQRMKALYPFLASADAQGPTAEAPDAKDSALALSKTPLQPSRLQTTGQIALDFLRANSYTEDLKNVDISALNPTQVALTFHSYLDQEDIICRRKIRMGKLDDGGWEVCDDPEVRPVPPCLVYSIGIGSDWSFDEDISEVYGCRVISLDPTIKLKEHNRTRLIHFLPWGIASSTGINSRGWQMYTLSAIKENLGHKDQVVTLIKMDVERAEWSSLPQMLLSGALAGVKQMLIEYHVGGGEGHKHLKAIQAMERNGFRRFYTRKNFHCERRQMHFPVRRTSCYEVAYMRV